MEAESSGNTEAWGDRSLGPGPGQYTGSLGLWQIYGAAHPSISAGCAKDPSCATDAARQISSNWTDWSPWSTFNSGAYLQHTQGQGAPPASSDAQLLAATKPGDVAQMIGNLFSTLRGGDAAKIATAWEGGTKDLAWRTGLVVVGIALVLIGTQLLFRPVAEMAVGGLLVGRSVSRMAR